MSNIKRTQHTMILVVVVLFITSVIMTLAAGISLKVAIVDNALDAFQVSYNLIGFVQASNQLILFSKLLDAGIFPILTVILATWFFDFINNFDLRERLLLSKVNKLKDHVIVAPYNSFAKSLLNELKEAGFKFVVIVENKKELAELYKEGMLAVDGDIRSVETFDIARANSAKCVVACSKDDLQNALIAVTARTSYHGVEIIARANKEDNIDRLTRSGAHKTVFPESTAGEAIGNEISKRVTPKKKPKT